MKFYSKQFLILLLHRCRHCCRCSANSLIKGQARGRKAALCTHGSSSLWWCLSVLPPTLSHSTSCWDQCTFLIQQVSTKPNTTIRRTFCVLIQCTTSDLSQLCFSSVVVTSTACCNHSCWARGQSQIARMALFPQIIVFQAVPTTLNLNVCQCIKRHCFLYCKNLFHCGSFTCHECLWFNCPSPVCLPLTHSSVAMVGPGNSSCATMCQCTNAVYEPVRGNNNVTYFSACSAGCQNRLEQDDGVSCLQLQSWTRAVHSSLSQTIVFANCSCVAETLSDMVYTDQQLSSLFLDTLAESSTANSMPCGNDCNTLAPFLTILLLALFLIFMVQIPITYMSMR